MRIGIDIDNCISNFDDVLLDVLYAIRKLNKNVLK